MRLAGKKQEIDLESLNNLGELGVALLPVEPEDMWHANNLIRPGDILNASASRKVVTESATGSTSSKRVHANLTISVVSTTFDPTQSSLLVSGVIKAENSLASVGQYHTLDLELQRQFTLWKKDGWDSVSVEELKASLREDKENNNATAAVVMCDTFANVCSITEFQTVIKQHVEGFSPKKHWSVAGSSADKSNKFFKKTLQALLDSADFSQPRLLVLASPGFTAENFKRYIAAEALQTGEAKLKRMAKDAVVVHSSTGHTHSLNEVLRDPAVAARVNDKKFVTESKLLDDLLTRLRSDDESVSSRTSYGVVPVAYAVDQGAVGRGGGVLFINNALFRAQDVFIRKRYVDIVNKVKEAGGQVQLLSSDHESGQRLDLLGGIAALLTYPLEMDYEKDYLDEAGNDDRDMLV